MKRKKPLASPRFPTRAQEEKREGQQIIKQLKSWVSDDAQVHISKFGKDFTAYVSRMEVIGSGSGRSEYEALVAMARDIGMR